MHDALSIWSMGQDPCVPVSRLLGQNREFTAVLRLDVLRIRPVVELGGSLFPSHAYITLSRPFGV